MCFSIEASLASGAVLTGFGVAAVLKAKTPAQKLFACTPLIFAVQQFSEAIVWLSLMYKDYVSWQQPATYFFLSIAHVIWPVWVPLCMLMMEKQKARRVALLVFFCMGLFLSLSLLLIMVFYKQHSVMGDSHIRYTSDFPHGFILSFVLPALYVLATVVSLFVSSTKRMPVLGIMVLLSAVIAHLFFSYYEVSIWCFFAAMMSAMVCGIIYDQVNTEVKNIVVVNTEITKITEDNTKNLP